eukprot:TRINITY_DN14692_c0_g1_i2.p2 TRINITY_DN14692_c0_g1~~TRINITY_DN14692_c0_g1_i2.p2  ORF type:complete len:145 (+),score=43.55 TRINITY_DN14692_c0_g1_i2:73-507(+)
MARYLSRLPWSHNHFVSSKRIPIPEGENCKFEFLKAYPDETTSNMPNHGDRSADAPEDAVINGLRREAEEGMWDEVFEIELDSDCSEWQSSASESESDDGSVDNYDSLLEQVSDPALTPTYSEDWVLTPTGAETMFAIETTDFL